MTTVWFNDFPLDFGRAETRKAEKLLIAGFPSTAEALRLAQSIGLDPAYLNQAGAPAATMRSVLEEARKSERLSWLIAEVLGNQSCSALHEPLRALIVGYEDAISAAAMQWKPSLATVANLPALPASLFATGAVGEAPKPLPGLEKMIIDAASFVDPAVLRNRLAEAEKRVARIDIGGHPKGTGFLVGDSLLLTNWHVVEDGVQSAAALFDHKIAVAGLPPSPGRTVLFAKDWLVARSPHDTIPVEQSRDGPPRGTWDFAIVRLAEPIGAQATGPDPNAPGERRGHYALDGGHYDFDQTEPLFIMGHPGGLALQFSQGVPANAKPTKYSNRVRYWTNTRDGSSGSPVFNKHWRVVALHHATGPMTASKKFDLETQDFNQGVPIAGIVEELRKQLENKLELAELGLTFVEENSARLLPTAPSKSLMETTLEAAMVSPLPLPPSPAAQPVTFDDREHEVLHKYKLLLTKNTPGKKFAIRSPIANDKWSWGFVPVLLFVFFSFLSIHVFFAIVVSLPLLAFVYFRSQAGTVIEINIQRRWIWVFHEFSGYGGGIWPPSVKLDIKYDQNSRVFVGTLFLAGIAIATSEAQSHESLEGHFQPLLDYLEKVRKLPPPGKQWRTSWG